MELSQADKDQAKSIIPSVIKLANLCVQFSLVDRVTHTDPGGRPESDTDHTFMLSMVACSIAQRYLPELDLGKVAQYALIHDFVEVYAGDEPTVFIDDEMLARKAEAEQAALKKLHLQFDKVFPWITDTIEAYESLSDPKSRFVKVIDKIMPSLTHLQDGGLTLRKLGVDTLEKLQESIDGRSANMQAYAYDQKFAMALRAELVELIRKQVFKPAT